MQITKSDLIRYEKQIILKEIGTVGQKKILSAKVMVVGLGGLGCPLVQYLASVGVGNIGMTDHDKIDFSNLNRQILFNAKDIILFCVFFSVAMSYFSVAKNGGKNYLCYSD